MKKRDYHAPSPAQGWRMVPVEPTREMQRAMYRELDGKHMPWVIEAVYRAMLAAAPPPPTEGDDE